MYPTVEVSFSTAYSSVHFAFSLPTGSAIFLVGIYDEPKSDKTFLNYPISTFFERTGISEDDLWPDEESRSMWNAKLYTRVTEGGLISDHLWMQDVEKYSSNMLRDFIAHYT